VRGVVVRKRVDRVIAVGWIAVVRVVVVRVVVGVVAPAILVAVMVVFAHGLPRVPLSVFRR
jgi:hypothetical protein